MLKYMKKIFIVGVLALIVIVTAGCNWRGWLGLDGNSTVPDADKKSPQVFTLKSVSSTLDWKLTKVHGFTGEGKMKFSGGSFIVDSQGVTGGTLAFDTTSLIKDGGTTAAAKYFKLTKYLSAVKYVPVTFTIDEIHSVDMRAQAPSTEYEVTGTLSAGLWSKQITFPIIFKQQGKELFGEATIAVPRAETAARTELPQEAISWIGTGTAVIQMHVVAVTQ